MSNHHHQKDFFWGAMIGGALGALTAMVFTTKKGKEIQKEILGKYNDLTDTVVGYANSKKKKVKSQLKKYANKAERKVQSTSKKVRKKIKQAKKEIEKKLNP